MKLRRRSVLTAAAVSLASLSGCTSLVLGDRAEFDAAKATVSEAGLEETDYEQRNSDQHTIEETVEVAGVERTVVATTWITTYAKSVELQGTEQEAAQFAVISTPAAEVAGRSFNPAESMSHEELLDRFGSQLENQGIDDIEHVDSRTEVVLGEEVEASTFETTTTFQGREIDLHVHVTTVTHEGDLIVAVGAHPAQLSQERTNAYTLMREIEHDGE